MAAKGKAELKVVMPEELKEQVDTEAKARGIDRSALICLRVQESYGLAPQDDVGLKVEQVIRDLDMLKQDFRAVVTLIETFVEDVGKSKGAPEKVYPAPASIEETYPEVKAMLAAPQGPAVDEDTPAAVTPVPEKRWPWSR
jgi:hypothetical protein